MSRASQLDPRRPWLLVLDGSSPSHRSRSLHPKVDALHQQVNDRIALLLSQGWACLLQGMLSLQLQIQIEVAVGPIGPREVRLGEVVGPLEPVMVLVWL